MPASEVHRGKESFDDRSTARKRVKVEQADEQRHGPGKRSEAISAIDELNRLSPQAFRERYLDALQLCHDFKGHGTRQQLKIEHHTAVSLPKDDFEACFSLIESTSKQDYVNSSGGWHPANKKREMREEHMHYLIVRSTSVQGFLSFMLTEDSLPVVPTSYIYEIHLAENVRRIGLGQKLFCICEDIARKTGMSKVMLTCFVSNTKAAGFYHSLGFAKDAVSPQERRTRRRVVLADYMILSKVLHGSPG